VQPQQTPEINTGQENGEEYKPTELVQIMDDSEQGVVDPTLPRLTEKDVAMDMDTKELWLKDPEDSSGSESSEDEVLVPDDLASNGEAGEKLAQIEA